MDEDLQARVKSADGLNWVERNITGPRGLTPEQKNEFRLAQYWFNAASDYARNGDLKMAMIFLNIAESHARPSNIDFSKRMEEVRSYYSTSSS